MLINRLFVINPVRRGVVAIALFACGANVWAQQSIANPLIRPALMQGTPAGATSTDANSAASARQQTEASATGDAAELRRQAERRITQEDLNIRQQALNSPVLPVPLVNLFANMQVTAHFQGAIVMRRVDNEVLSAQSVQVSQTSANSAARGGEGASSVATAPRIVSRSSAALRLRVGKTENVSGYLLRAKVEGQDITVDWLSDGGVWVNVFFGALESSAGGVPLVPSDSQLLKVETEQFKHLVPVLRTQTFSPSGTLGGQPGGNFGSGFGGGGLGGGFGGNSGFNNQPGFGTGFPN